MNVQCSAPLTNLTPTGRLARALRLLEISAARPTGSQTLDAALRSTLTAVTRLGVVLRSDLVPVPLLLQAEELLDIWMLTPKTTA